MLMPSHRAMLMATAAAAALQAMTVTTLAAQEAIALDPIDVEEEAATGTTIVTGDADDIGTTILSDGALEARSDGSGDANMALTTLPTVQYRNDAAEDGGQNTDDVLTLKPQELSISGGRVTENNFMIDGVGINALTGNESPTTSTDLNREDNQPNLYSFYGLHSQTQFVPSELVESVEVIDSNVAAEHGGFQGGVVDYRLKRPSTDRASGSVSFRFQNDDMVNYKLATEDGENPKDRPKPQFTKRQFSAQFNQPLSDRTALSFGFGTRRAEARKPMDAQYRDRYAPNQSRSDFYRLSLSHELEGGGKLSFSGNLTNYEQEWTSNYAEDFDLDVKTRSVSLDAGYEKSWEALSLGGLDLRNARFRFKAVHQDNTASNENDRNEYFSWSGSYFLRGETFVTDAFNAWCDVPAGTTESIACRRGGHGSTEYGDTRDRIEARFDGDIWQGSFALGAAVERVEAERSGSGFTYNSVTERLDPSASFGAFTCAPGDPSCLPDQYFDIRIKQDPYDVTVDATKTEAYAEIDQSWGDFGLRAGLRVDHNDVLDNVDVAPRLSASWTPRSDLAITLGANRYYSGTYLAYALHDALPRGETQMRGHDDTSGAVEDWQTRFDLGRYSYSQGDLKTPYVDEASLGVIYEDGWTGGSWRLHLIDRQGKDQFARSDDSSATDNRLTNDGENEYRSLSLEYRKQWDTASAGPLDGISLYVSGAWAERKTSNDTYFGNEGD
ncbi:MAG: hypothetical protein ACLFRU_09965, partial [Paracoccaceae bacterium]